MRTTHDDKDSVSETIIAEEVKRLNDDIIQAIKNREANAETDALAKEDHMEGAWMIEEDPKITRCQSELW